MNNVNIVPGKIFLISPERGVADILQPVNLGLYPSVAPFEGVGAALVIRSVFEDIAPADPEMPAEQLQDRFHRKLEILCLIQDPENVFRYVFGEVFSPGIFDIVQRPGTAGVFWQDIAINGAGVFPLVLCCVKRQIGLAVQLVERYPIGREIRDADRPRNLIGPILSRISGPEFPAQLFRFGHCVLDLGDIAQEDDKFVPADPPDDIALAEYAPDFLAISERTASPKI